MKRIVLANGLSVEPAEAATQVIAALGMRGSGKSNSMAVLVEGMLSARVQVVVLDYVGIWFSLRLRPDGKTASDYAIPVLGGPHGDVAMEAGAGAIVARALASSGSPAVLDVSGFTKNDRGRFATDFAETFFHEKKRHPGPCFLLLEEAQRFCLSLDTEILTSNGWRNHKEVRIGDLAVAFNLMTEECSLEPVEDVLTQEFEGDLVRLKTTSIDSEVTSNHRIVLRRFQHDPKRYKLYPWAHCQAAKIPSQFVVPSSRPFCGRGVQISDDIIRVVGWLITDGYFHTKSRGYLGIQQAITTVKLGKQIAATMQCCLERLGVRGSYYRPAHITRAPQGLVRASPSIQFFFGVKLSNLIRKWTGSDIHRIPRTILDQASLPQLQLLYETLMEGDGTAVDGKWAKFYAGKNEPLADDFQELATKLGLRTLKQCVPQNSQWVVRISHTHDHWIRASSVSRRKYKGQVWCVTLPSGAFVARRNGTVFITGNCPQKLFHGQERMLGAFEEIAEVGRNYGIGLGMMSQRPQKISKDVLNLTELLFAFQSNGVLERKAISEWVQEKGAEGREDVHGELPGLAVGKALVWSPRWLKIYGQYAIRMKSTYDAGATPIHARARVKMKSLDLDELKASMAEVVDAAEKVDPKLLQAEVARLRAQVARLEARTTVEPRKAEAQKAPDVFSTADFKRVEHLADKLSKSEESFKAALAVVTDRLAQAQQAIVSEVGNLIAKIASGRQPQALGKRQDSDLERGRRFIGEPGPRQARPLSPVASDLSPSFGKGERKILIAVAQYPSGVTREQLSVMVAYKRSTRDLYIQHLKAANLVSSSGQYIVATSEGLAKLGDDYELLPTGEALRIYHLERLPEGERRILEVLVDNYPNSISRESIDQLTGYKRSTRDLYLQHLKARRLIGVEVGGEVSANSLLFG